MKFLYEKCGVTELLLINNKPLINADREVRMVRSTEEFRVELKKFLELQPEVIAAWEGGSAATGFLDDYSDLDLSIVIRDGDQDQIFARLDDYLDSLYGIEKRFRLPEPTWHGMSQCLYLLKGFPPLFYADVVVVKEDNPQKLTEPDRHGNSVIWFDKEMIYSAKETPQEELDRLRERFFRIGTDLDWLSIIELRKALVRKNWLAAQRCYLQFINRHLVSLLNLKYRPAKADFGMRYAERDFPPEVVKRLEEMIRIRSVEDIAERLPEALEMYKKLKEELS